MDDFLRRGANHGEKDVESVAILEHGNMANLIVVWSIAERAWPSLKSFKRIGRVNQTAKPHDPVELAVMLEDTQIGVFSDGGLRCEMKPIGRYCDLRVLR